MLEYTVLHLFSGIGGAALGFQEAKAEYKGLLGSFRTLAGIDCDPEACRDFEAITGAPAVEMDLFSRSDHITFHGKQPPGEWVEVMPQDIVEATNGEYPDVIFLSPPCKGFSGLLPNEKAKSDKYQALNRLVLRGLKLVLDAYMDDLPSVIMLENVPRITSRGELLLKQVKRLLGRHGYVFHEGTHDCGELGGLGQHRKRYLLIARLPEKMPNFIYRPPIRELKSIGDVVGPLPLPDDPTMGPMHRLPRLQWKTWVRLALIPAGGDWRDLETCENYGLEYVPRDGGWQVAPWDDAAGTVVGSARVGHSNGVAAIADPRRIPFNNIFKVTKWDDTPGAVTSGNGQTGTIVADPRTGFKDSTHRAIYRVVAWDEAGPTVTGANRPNNGAITVADPRPVQWRNGWKLSGAEGRINEWDKPTDVVLGHSGVRSNGASCIADPRVSGGYSNKRKVLDWGQPATTVTGTPDTQSGAQSIADPRVKTNLYPSSYGVNDWNDPAPTIRSAGRTMNAPVSVADPRLGCKPRNGTMGVQAWDEPAKTIIGSGDIHAGAAAVADPRIPKDTEVLEPPPIIIALDGTWHRPLTTFELAMLQGFPPMLADGSPLQLSGKSDARWRERIGNTVPPPTARAIGEEILLALMSAKDNLWMLSSTGIWVHSESVIENAEVLQ